MQQITPGDPETQSEDVLGENVAQLGALFPEAIADGRIDFDVLRQLLGGAVEDREEKYGLTWHGKRRARQIALAPSTGTLRPCPEESVDWSTTQNLMIEGDNLEVLKLLQKSYSGKVKLIYIDPPYNTGKDFVYPDDFRDSIKNYLELTGQVGDGGQRLSTNTEASGRFHTDWLNMMYPRLKLARQLLSEDGVLCVSIDDNEVDHLVRECNELFGEENFIGLVVVQLNPRGRHLDRFIARTHEYLALYVRDASTNAMSSIPKDERMAAEYSRSDDRGRYRELELRNRNPAFNSRTRPNLHYPIFVDPDTGAVSVARASSTAVEVWPRNSEGGESCWTWGREKLATDGAIVRGRQVADGGWRIYRRDYLLDESGESATTLAKSLWIDKDINNDVGKKAIQDLFGQTVFDFPKSPALIRRILEIGCGPAGIVLDFFAGSGTTAEAVMRQNAADTGARRYVLVQLPEVLDPGSASQKPAADFCDSLGRPRTIAELAKERLRRAGAKIRDENPIFAGDTGFRVFKLDSTNIQAWEPDRDDLAGTLEGAVEHLKADRVEQDILYELLLKLGLDLCVPIERREIAGKEVHAVGGGALLVCLAPSIDRADVEDLAHGIAAWFGDLAPAGDATCVFRDGAFEDDVAKTNMAAILAQRGLLRVRSL